MDSASGGSAADTAAADTNTELKQQRSAALKALARDAGFDLVGVAPVALDEAYTRYRLAMDEGFGAAMRWLYERPELRRDVREVHPQAKSVVVVGVSYASDGPGYLEQPPAAGEGWIARYAQGRDYHSYIKKKLIRLVKSFADVPLLATHGSKEHRVFVDTGPVLEKAYAQAAGLGWIGKHTLVIHPREGAASPGSWYFLGVILTPLELALDTPATDQCGSCRRCIDVCPTDAIVEPYRLDARRCIATWTIETDDPPTVIDADQVGQHIFGCDLCQEVCPWNRRAEPSAHEPLLPRPANVRPSLEELRGLDADAFRARFPNSAVRRVSAEQLSATIGVIAARNDRTRVPESPTAHEPDEASERF